MAKEEEKCSYLLIWSRVARKEETLPTLEAMLSKRTIKIHCDDHSLLSSTTAVLIRIISYIHHIISLLMGDMNSVN